MGTDASPRRDGSNRVVLSNARLADGRLVDVHVTDGRISSVDPAGSTDERRWRDRGEDDDPRGREAVQVHDLRGWLLLPALAEPHAHLDKALTAELVPNPSGDLLGAIDAWIAASDAGRITYEGIVERAARAMDLLVVHGVTAVRTHVNVLADIGATAVKAVKEAAAGHEDILDVQVVALCGSPMTGREGAGTRAALAAAIEAGADLIGGCPHLDPDGPGAIDVAIDAATDAGLGIDLHVDEMLDPSVLTLRDYARKVLDTGFPHPVAASHCVTLGMQPRHVQTEVSLLVAEAGMAVVPLPQTNLFLQGRDHPTATPRGLTALQALTEAGVLVAAGGDNVQDPFNLVGRSDPLETASLLVMAGHRLPEEAYDMVSNRVRRALGLEPVTMAVGDPADLVAIDAPSVRGAIADAPRSRRVFRRGRLVAQSDQQFQVHRS